MTHTNLKKLRSERGFTIVELLIVIVVIGILAAIVIVAYNGIQNRAKGTAAKASAETVTKKAEAANAVVAVYPDSVTNSGTIPNTSFFYQEDSKLDGSGITMVASLTASSPTSNVIYQKCTTPAAGKPSQQARVGYWDASLSTPAVAYMYLGGSAAGDCTTWGTALTGGPW